MGNTAVTILDGAMGTELRARGVKVPDYKSSIWSALAIMEAPDAIRRVHSDYIAAGADVITVNNYAVTRKLLAREGLEDRLPDLTEAACRLAVEARDAAARPARIAGSLAPLDTSYRHDLVGPYEDNLAAYREAAACLAPHVDIMLCETLTLAEEARAAATAAAETGREVWVSCTLAPDGRVLRGGEDMATVLAALKDLPIAAFLFNCCATDPVSEALPGLVAATDKSVGAYCNPVRKELSGGEPESVIALPLGPDEYADVAFSWVESGVRIVGGCCDTSPEYIARIRDRVSVKTETE